MKLVNRDGDFQFQSEWVGRYQYTWYQNYDAEFDDLWITSFREVHPYDLSDYPWATCLKDGTVTVYLKGRRVDRFTIDLEDDLGYPISYEDVLATLRRAVRRAANGIEPRIDHT